MKKINPSDVKSIDIWGTGIMVYPENHNVLGNNGVGILSKSNSQYQIFWSSGAESTHFLDLQKLVDTYDVQLYIAEPIVTNKTT